KTLYKLFAVNPFYGIFISELGKKILEDSIQIPTACVSKIPGSINVDLIINLTFLETLTKEQRLTVLAHEAQHVILEHFFYADEFFGNLSQQEKHLSNIAFDMHINQNLIKENFAKLPDYCFMLPST